MSDCVKGLVGPSFRIPKYCRQKRKGRPDRAYVVIDGRKISLGKYGNESGRQKYAELIGGTGGTTDDSAAADTGRQMALDPTDPSVTELLIRFLKWAKDYYDAREYGHFKTVGVARFCRTGQVLRLRCYNQAQRSVSWLRRPRGKSVHSVDNTVTI